MRVKTPILVLVGFISLATFGSAVHTEANAKPLKHRVLSEAKHGSKKHVASQVSSSTAS